jgi:hypothetical protein
MAFRNGQRDVWQASPEAIVLIYAVPWLPRAALKFESFINISTPAEMKVAAAFRAVSAPVSPSANFVCHLQGFSCRAGNQPGTTEGKFFAIRPRRFSCRAGAGTGGEGGSAEQPHLKPSAATHKWGNSVAGANGKPMRKKDKQIERRGARTKNGLDHIIPLSPLALSIR